ncbi:DUF2750 domain-containing protein [Ningiella sp. W23]|uniref:DUF2750 domain-containing protein n=1 Tax=Ningiella sp. W23 TaxID=3023715 RepID=UPI003757FC5C
MQSNELVMQMSADKRYRYLVDQAKQNETLWILTDDDGCVMLNAEDEDCVPVWPAKDFANYWATGEWEHCRAQAISLEDWLERWTPGLEEDDLLLVAFPNPNEQGLVIEPDMFDEDLRSV